MGDDSHPSGASDAAAARQDSGSQPTPTTPTVLPVASDDPWAEEITIARRDVDTILSPDEPDTDTDMGSLIQRDATSLSALLETGASPLVSGIQSVPPDGALDSPVTPYSFSVPQPARALVATLTVLRGPEPGKVFVLDSDAAVIGRSCCAGIQIEENAVSRSHARVFRDGSGEWYLDDLQSKNGTFVGEQRVRRARIYSGDRLLLGPNVALRFGVVAEDEVHLQRELFAASTWDALTGILNRETALSNVASAVKAALAAGEPLGVIVLDVDRFKSINDTFGHGAGDNVLRAVALAVKRALRKRDIVGRLGGDEFVIVAPGVSRHEAAALAERVRAQVASLAVEVGNGSLSVTVSVGAAVLSEVPSRLPAGLLELADARMYAAKRAGRDRVAECPASRPRL